ncbi:MAG: SGNH/GDSL hydrolase family protein [Lachnospiraceae bacterium]|nr:SGNH/GDSL hydrolase family protein [Lachnospiraceae bacterium]
MLPHGTVNIGNLSRLRGVLEKTCKGNEITIGFIGGSITQGSLATKEENCYAFRVYQWLEKKFPLSKVNYVNAGIGATTSQYGVARVNRDLLVHRPDIVFVEFSVNDEANIFFEETYEGILRNILNDCTDPFVVIINNMFYNNGRNAQEFHNRIGREYEIPIVSMKDSIYNDIKEGKIKASDVTPDMLHPNDSGHELVAEKITLFLEYLFEEAKYSFEGYRMIMPITKNRFQYSKILNNVNLKISGTGFLADNKKKKGITDIFKTGWLATKKGDFFEVNIEGSYFAVQYRKTIQKPAPVCRLLIDDFEEIILDGNFCENWGDCLYLQTLAYGLENRTHNIRVEVIEVDPNSKTPFYLAAFIVG